MKEELEKMLRPMVLSHQPVRFETSQSGEDDHGGGGEGEDDHGGGKGHDKIGGFKLF